MQSQQLENQFSFYCRYINPKVDNGKVHPALAVVEEVRHSGFCKSMWNEIAAVAGFAELSQF